MPRSNRKLPPGLEEPLALWSSFPPLCLEGDLRELRGLPWLGKVEHPGSARRVLEEHFEVTQSQGSVYGRDQYC